MSSLRVALLATFMLTACSCAPRAPAPVPTSTNPPQQLTPSPSPTSPCKNPAAGQPWVCLEDTRTPLPPGAPSPAPLPSETPFPHTFFFQATAAAVCPQIDPAIEPTIPDAPPLDEVSGCYFDPGPSVLALLNRGASQATVALALDAAFPFASTKHALSQMDLTGDGIPEVALSLFDLYIFGCQSGQYVVLLDAPIPDIANSCDPPTIENVTDINLNGRPDILIHSFFLPWHFWQIVEWQESSFASLLEPPVPHFHWRDHAYAQQATAEVRDLDSDGIRELLVTGGFTNDPERVPQPDLPWPQTIQIYAWAGGRYSLLSIEDVSQ